MEARDPHAAVCRHTHIRITTEHPTEFVDLTDRLEALVAEAGIRFGFVNVQSAPYHDGHRRERTRAAAADRLREPAREHRAREPAVSARRS